MQVELVETFEGLVELAPAWSELLQHAQGGLDVFRSPEWVLPWWRHIGGDSRIHCLVVREEGRLAGLAPLAVAREGGAAVLRFMGDPLNDYNGFVLRRGCEAPAARAIFRHLAGNAAAWDRIEFDCILQPEVAVGIADAAGAGGLTSVPLTPPPTVLLPLPREWDTYRTGPVTGRRTLERKERKLRREAETEFRVCRDPVSAAAVVPELERLRLANWRAFGFAASRDALLFGESFSAFLKEASPLLAEAGRLRVGVIEGRDGVLAAGLYLAGDGVLMKYMQGWDHTDPASSVGLILDWLMIRHAIENGLEWFDFGRGDEAYKFRLGGRAHDLVGYQLFPTSLRGRLGWTRAAALHSARLLKRRLARSAPDPVSRSAPDAA